MEYERIDPKEIAEGLGAEEVSASEFRFRHVAERTMPSIPNRENAGSSPAVPTSSSGVWTITRVMHRQPTESKLEMLARADRIFRERCGRYYMGPMTREEVRQLTEKVELGDTMRASVDEFVNGPVAQRSAPAS